MKRRKTIKTMAFALAMTAGLLLPATMNAQSGRNDDFFRGGIDNNDNRSDDGLTFGDNPMQPTAAPLGSGLLLLTAMGAGYALLKKKED